MMLAMPMVAISTATAGWPDSGPQHGALDQHRQHADDPQRDDERQPGRQLERDRTGVVDVGAQHHHLADREVDDAGALVDEHEAQRHQRRDAAGQDAQDRILDEFVHAAALLSAPR
jgi:hypothetical protein